MSDSDPDNTFPLGLLDDDEPTFQCHQLNDEDVG